MLSPMYHYRVPTHSPSCAHYNDSHPAGEQQASSAQSFVLGLLQAVAEVMGSRAITEAAVQTAEYDGSPLSLALQQLESSYLKQSKVFLHLPCFCSTHAFTACAAASCAPHCELTHLPICLFVSPMSLMHACVHSPVAFCTNLIPVRKGDRTLFVHPE